MEVLTKNRSLLVILSLVAVLGTNIPVCANPGEKTTKTVEEKPSWSNWFGLKKQSWSPWEVGLTTGLSVLGCTAIYAKKPFLTMAATTGLSVFLAYKLSNSSIEEAIERVEAKVEKNGGLIKTVTKKIKGLWDYVKKEFGLVNEKLSKLETNIEEVKKTQPNISKSPQFWKLSFSSIQHRASKKRELFGQKRSQLKTKIKNFQNFYLLIIE